jgi:hypothetical protein
MSTETRASAPTFSSPAGVFSTSVVTPAMVRALDTFTDRFRIEGSSQTLRKLIRYGLAEKRGLGVAITHAGLNVLCLYPPVPDHKIRYSHGSVPVGGTERRSLRDGLLIHSLSMLFSAYCSCGWHYHGEEVGRRGAVKAHKLAVRT